MKNKLTESKIEVMKNLLKSMEEESSALNGSVKRLDSYKFGLKDISNKFKDHVEKKRKELSIQIKEGKLNQQIANLIFNHLNDSHQFLKNESNEAEKFFNVRQGELLSLRNQIKKINDIIVDLEARSRAELEVEENKSSLEEKSSSENPSEDEIEVKFDIEEESQSSKAQEERIRPDKNPNTKIGRAAIDLAERKRQSKMTQKKEDNNLKKR